MVNIVAEWTCIECKVFLTLYELYPRHTTYVEPSNMGLVPIPTNKKAIMN